MFVRAKKSGPYQYLQVVENRREGAKVEQRVVSTLGRLDRLNAKGDIESLVRSLSRFSQQALLVLSGKSELLAEALRPVHRYLKCLPRIPAYCGCLGDNLLLKIDIINKSSSAILLLKKAKLNIINTNKMLSGSTDMK